MSLPKQEVLVRVLAQSRIWCKITELDLPVLRGLGDILGCRSYTTGNLFSAKDYREEMEGSVTKTLDGVYSITQEHPIGADMLGHGEKGSFGSEAW